MLLDDLPLSGISYDSRNIRPGEVFVAIPGAKVDGAGFVPHAINNGAAIIVTEDSNVAVPLTVKKIVVPSARQALAILADRFYGHPSQKLKIIGITGTNGKTTTAYLIRAILEKAGYKVGLLGTIDTPTGLTTPESLELHNWLADCVDKGMTHVVMEVSSHALAQDRVYGVEFDVAIFTNLTHDHLDFHKTMEEYLLAKRKMFERLGTGEKKNAVAIINVDDPYSSGIIEVVRGEVIAYGIHQMRHEFRSAKEHDIELSVEDYKITADRMTINIDGREIKTPLLGVYNIYNILAAAECGLVLKISRKTVFEAVEQLQGIPGRLEFVNCGQLFKVIVDFAHSPDALEKLLTTARAITPKGGRIILVFGCPGDRDKEKRPIMGKLAQKLADYVIITTDDPHTESPEQILNEIAAGMDTSSKNFQKILDRTLAIGTAIDQARNHDLLIVAGRGPEKYQDFNGKKILFDDHAAVQEIYDAKKIQ